MSDVFSIELPFFEVKQQDFDSMMGASDPAALMEQHGTILPEAPFQTEPCELRAIRDIDALLAGFCE